MGLNTHIGRALSATLPGTRTPFFVGTHAVGYVAPADIPALCAAGCVEHEKSITWQNPQTLQTLARTLANQGFTRWRDEAFGVFADHNGLPLGPVLAQADRGALAFLGIAATGVHLNGLVHRANGLHLWVARRALAKMPEPGKFDHIVAGGIPAGLTPAQTLIKEAAEEAGMAPNLATTAKLTNRLAYTLDRPEGLRRDLIYCYDIDLPEDFTPTPVDGEVAGFELWPIGQALDTVRAGDAFKYNVNFVLIDLFARLGLINLAEVPGLTRLRVNT